jgi:integrase/recombinase XerD
VAANASDNRNRGTDAARGPGFRQCVIPFLTSTCVNRANGSSRARAGGAGRPPVPGEGSPRAVVSRQRSASPPGLLDEVADELLPAHLWPDVRQRLLVTGWLAGFRSPRTRRAYGGDLLAWQRWCTTRGLDPLEARRVQVDLYLADLLDSGAAPASAGRRLSALASFYRFLLEQDDLHLTQTNPAAAVRRPALDPQHSPTLGLTRGEAAALLDAADQARGPQRRRNAALLRVLLYNALRVDEVLGAKLADLGRHPGREDVHDTLTIRRKGGRLARIALAPATVEALRHYLQDRARNEDSAPEKLTGPLFASRHGRQLVPKTVWELVRRTARHADIATWSKLSPHSLRHTAITLALDAGASLRDVQDFAGHRDPRTTRRYDRAREDLDRSPTYALARWLADGGERPQI